MNEENSRKQSRGGQAMITSTTPNGDDLPNDLLSLFENPIADVSQVIRRGVFTKRPHEFELAWGGNRPVLVIHFDRPRENESLLVTCARDRVVWRLVEGGFDDDAKLQSEIRSFATAFDDRPPDELAYEEDDLEAGTNEIIGVFSLNCILSPIPDWPRIGVTKATLIWRKVSHSDRPLLGFCLWVNLGIRLGVFVPPTEGFALSLNDSCDIILRCAEEAEARGLVRIESREYPGRETPGQMTSIDWFDWLRRG